MANLTPNEYFKIEGPIRSSRLRYQETDSFDDKTGKDIPASVDFVGQNDRVIFLSMNKKGEVRIMTFKIVNKEGTITKPEDVIDSIKNDSDFPGADITDYVKKILGKKYEDILTEDPTKADQFITKHVTNYNGVSKAYFVKNIEIIQTPWDPNVVPTQPTGPPPVENKIVTTTEPTVATSSVGPSASNVDDSNVGASASNVGATASILGEFTFNVEQDNTFIGVNNQFGTLYTIGIGEIKEEPIDKPEEGELLPEEGLDEEYSEEGFSGLEETSIKIDYTPTEADKQSEVTDTKTLSGPVEITKPKEGEMTISAAGLKKLKAHEGSRSTIYDDATGGSIASYASCKGFPTIGVGHLIDKNERSIFSKYLKPGKMSSDEIDNLLLKDLASRIKDLNKKLKVKVTQGQFEALLSMGFNTGFGNKSFLKAIEFTNKGEKEKASNQINSGPKTSKGAVVPGLVTRRKDESVAYLA